MKITIFDFIWQTVKGRVVAYEKNIKALNNLNLQATNEILIKIATEMSKLPESLEFLEKLA